MCGRIHPAPIDAYDDFLGGDLGGTRVNPEKQYNLGPGDMAPVVYMHDGRVVYELMHWRLMPGNIATEEKAKDFSKQFNKTFNARSESLMKSRLFGTSFKAGRRCAVLFHGFFEWTGAAGKKTPHYIRPKGDGPFALAGIYTFSPAMGVNTVAVITTEASKGLMADLHHRMPVILEADQIMHWIDNTGEVDENDQLAMLVPYPSEKLEAWPVSKAVNNPRYDGEEVLKEG